MNLPVKSQASYLKGIWFVFNIEEDTIHIFLSLTGKEKIFLNKKLIIENRQLTKFTSNHKLQINNNKYAIEIKIPNKGKMEIFCTLFKNNRYLDSMICKREYKKSNKDKVILFLILPIIGGIILATIGLTDWITISIITIIILTIFYSLKGKNNLIIINESSPL